MSDSATQRPSAATARKQLLAVLAIAVMGFIAGATLEWAVWPAQRPSERARAVIEGWRSSDKAPVSVR